MEGKLLVCLFLCAIVCDAVLGQVASLCRPKERLLMCGCPKTCRDPAPNCEAVCVPGCFCDEGQVRNDEGLCVKLADCPPIKSAYTLDTTEPRKNFGKCPKNEEYRYCEPCTRTCDNPNPICPAQCNSGCFCIDGLLRDQDGQCVKPEACIKTIETKYEMICADHQVYKACGTCEKTCSEPNPTCPKMCAVGCFCEEGYVKAPNGLCVKPKDCPPAAEGMSTIYMSAASEALLAHDPTIEDCSPDEEYFSCGWCEPSCSNPAPSCPRMCTTGCLCKHPLLRHHNGRCVEERDCHREKCKDSNEEFICLSGCEQTCQPRQCPIRARRCVLGCYCKFGLFRDISTARCVTADMCANISSTIEFSRIGSRLMFN